MNLKIEMIDGDLDPKFIDFAKECIKDTKLKHVGLGIDPATLADTLQFFAKDPEKVFFLARVDHQIVGIFLGEAKNYPFTNVKVAVELYFRVADEFRGQGVGKFLIKDFEIWAQQHGCKFSICGVNEFSSNATLEANHRLQREGYRHYGTEYFKEL